MNIGQRIVAINIFTAVCKALLVHIVISASWELGEELSLGLFTDAETKREEQEGRAPAAHGALPPGRLCAAPARTPSRGLLSNWLRDVPLVSALQRGAGRG